MVLSPRNPPSPAPDEAPDPSVLRAERRLRLLEELAEIGMALARDLKPAAASGEARADEAATGRAPADAFAPLSRAIRLTLALEARTDRDLRDLQAGVARAREEDRVRSAARHKLAAAEDREARTEQIHELVRTVAAAEAEGEAEFRALCEALEERLEDDEAYDDCADRPFRETVERLCRDLTLTPDWSRWQGEGWIAEGPPARRRCSPFNTPSASRLLDDHGAPLASQIPPTPPGPRLE